MVKKTHIILSVGGSIIIPKTGFDISFLKSFQDMIIKRVKKGDKFILVIGGGATCRQYQDALKHVKKTTDTELDWLGIKATVFNAHFVRMLFGDYAYQDVVTDPRYRIKTNKPVIVAAGWKPGNSTDHGSVLLAKAYGAKQLLNLSNIECVFDKDPNMHSDAKRIARIDWSTFRRTIVGHIWSPGSSAPFDPIASKLAQKLHLQVSVLRGTDLKNVSRALDQKSFIGTVIF